MSINSEMTSLADAIRNKSGVSGKLTITDMTTAVNGIEIYSGSDIDLSGVTVTADKMLDGVVAVGADGNKVTGNIPESTVTETDSSVTITPGYVGKTLQYDLKSGGAVDASLGFINSNGYFQELDLSGNSVVISGQPESIDKLVTYQLGSVVEEQVPLRLQLTSGCESSDIYLQYQYCTDSIMQPIITPIDTLHYRTASTNGKWVKLLRSIEDGRSTTIRLRSDGDTWVEFWNSSKFFSLGLPEVYAESTASDTLDSDTSLQKNPHGNAFRFTGQLAASGNVMSLVDYRELTPFCFSNLFFGATGLMTAPELPATNLAPYCYHRMFAGTSIASAPELPATALAKGCYLRMFAECPNLTTTPELPATVLAPSCYSAMFDESPAITSAPELPATTAPESCYYHMFSGTSITQPPELPATNLAPYCYAYMFAGTLISEAPELPAMSLADGCYDSMFAGTLISEPPELQATSLAKYCYRSMFSNCANLINAPELPATYLEDGCYASMFTDCVNLKSIKVHFTEWDYEVFGSTRIFDESSATYRWVDGVLASGTFSKPSALPEEYSGAMQIPVGWFVFNND